MMLRRVLAEVRRSLSSGAPAKAESTQSATVSDLTTGFMQLLRKPLTHPRQFNYETLAWLSAGMRSAEYMLHNMMDARNLVERMELLDFALDQCSLDGLMLEFGVHTGGSLRAIARRTSQTVHGFDSFEGLPQDWTYFQKQGRFGLGGKMPVFSEPNVELHKGLFEATLPGFLATHPGPARFLHVDCDLYSSARAVLQLLSDRITAGTVIVFDEYLNYPGWEQHEFKAFAEFVANTSRSYRYLGFASADCSVAVQLTG